MALQGVQPSMRIFSPLHPNTVTPDSESLSGVTHPDFRFPRVGSTIYTAVREIIGL